MSVRNSIESNVQKTTPAGLNIPDDAPVMTNERLLAASAHYIVSSVFAALRRGGRSIVLYQQDKNLANKQMRDTLRYSIGQAAAEGGLAEKGRPGYPSELAKIREALVDCVINTIEDTTEVLPDDIRVPGAYGTVYGTFQNYLSERNLKLLPETLSVTKADLLADPTTSYWLKEQLRTMDVRDPVDMLADIEAIQRLLKLQVQTLTDGGR